MSTTPFFTVLIAVYNGAGTLQACLDSITQQGNDVAEVVVMDGASTDETRSILERNDRGIEFWRSEPDAGIADAWNKAIPHARGDWLIFLGADDQLASSDTLGRAKAALSTLDPSFEIAYGRVDVVDEKGSVVRSAGAPWEVAGADFYEFNTVPHQAVFHRRSVFDQIGVFDEDFRLLADYELLIRAFKRHVPAYLDMTIARFGSGGLSERPDAMFLATREAYRARYRNGLERWPEPFAPRILRASAFELVRRVAGPGLARALADRYHGRASNRS